MDDREMLDDLDELPMKQSKKIDWNVFEVYMLSMPLLVDACKHFNVCDTHLLSQIYDKTGLTFIEYRNFCLQDVVLRIKQAAILKATDGDIVAIKYVLNNISDWSDKVVLETAKEANITLTISKDDSEL